MNISDGAFPKKVAENIKCSIEEAQIIFDAYHNEMYADITKFRDEVTSDAQTNGYTHLGLGCRLYSDDIGSDVRTLFNANSQFWSILVLLAINKMHSLIDEQGLENDVLCIGTIYDSVYYLVKKDATTVKWLNDTLIPTMCTQVFEDEEVHNEAELDIGPNWSDLTTISNDASLEDIEKIIQEIR